MNILVTGGAGFIGSHLVDGLVEAGHHVVVVDNLSTGCREHVHDQAVFYEMDILQKDELARIFADGAFDIVFHEAAQTLVPYSMEHPREDAELNIMGLLNVLELCRQFGVKKFLFSSSAAVYGDNVQVPLAENTPLQPTSFYGLTKVTAEKYIQMYHDVFGLSYAILRYSNVYGERAEVGGEGGVINVFAKRAARDMDITVYGDGSQSRDYIYVGDIANGIVCALTTEQADEVYHLSTGRESSLLDVLAELRRASGKELTPNFARTRSGDIYRSVLSNEKARRLLGWEPYMKLKDGIILTYQYAAGQGGR